VTAIPRSSYLGANDSEEDEELHQVLAASAAAAAAAAGAGGSSGSSGSRRSSGSGSGSTVGRRRGPPKPDPVDAAYGNSDDNDSEVQEVSAAAARAERLQTGVGVNSEVVKTVNGIRITAEHIDRLMVSSCTCAATPLSTYQCNVAYVALFVGVCYASDRVNVTLLALALLV
jgi:hypothetical protein